MCPGPRRIGMYPAPVLAGAPGSGVGWDPGKGLPGWAVSEG